MRASSLAIAIGLMTTASAAAQTVVPDANAPKGKLPDLATPVAYRLDFTILPESARFSGHDEIDITLNAAAKSLYMHGRDLTVKRALATVAGGAVQGTWTQVDTTGTARLDFPRPLPPGKVTLSFDYSAPFGETASGMFHVDVGGHWYSWTQFESIEARAAFPGFDEPGFKTPFTVSVTTHPGFVVVGNAPEVSVTKTAEGMETHRFAATRPLPTYLVAVDTGPFVRRTGTIPADAERPSALPFGAVATQAQKDKMDYVMAETPRIVQLLENYFGQPFPFPKVDQIGSPIMPGAMENAGADTYGDGIIYLAPGATIGDKQSFGMIVAHELSHQWFGDLVTPAWWDDIWLNESFANWMGYRIGNEWRPQLKIGLGAIREGLAAMSTDGLIVGRAIHQHISNNSQIDSAFDNITYGKGGHVVAMIAAYLGDEKFRDGVRLHLNRHRYGNATSDQFFQAIADAAHEPKVLAAFRSFVDQPGVPVVDVRRDGTTLVATQSRYAYAGSTPPAETWTIPFCFRVGPTEHCTLLDQHVTTIEAPGTGTIMPNVGGTGYYRFDLAPEDWRALIASAAELPAGEALATTDSLWASFTAGRTAASSLIEEAREMAKNPDSMASVAPAGHLSSMYLRGLVAPASKAAYASLLEPIYKPRLTALGFNPAFGAHADDAPDRQQLRQRLVDLMAFDANDPAIRTTLKEAAGKYLSGDAAAVDPAFLGAALQVVAEDGDLTTARTLVDKALSTEDPTVRQAELAAAASSGHTDVAAYLLNLDDKRLRGFDRELLIVVLAQTAGTRDFAADWFLANYGKLLTRFNGIFAAGLVPGALGTQCSVEEADRIERTLGPTIEKAGVQVLDFKRTIEAVRDCGVLKQSKMAEVAAALAR
ncbi:MAG TPA: M1 family aminopeptidase [Vicinamibacterales bacterium]|nr:M1 family aminopeptidase [Vicinamibacterales bacterium]